MTHLTCHDRGRKVDMLKEFGVVGTGKLWQAHGRLAPTVTCPECWRVPWDPTPDFRYEMLMHTLREKTTDVIHIHGHDDTVNQIIMCKQAIMIEEARAEQEAHAEQEENAEQEAHAEQGDEFPVVSKFDLLTDYLRRTGVPEAPKRTASSSSSEQPKDGGWGNNPIRNWRRMVEAVTKGRCA